MTASFRPAEVHWEPDPDLPAPDPLLAAVADEVVAGSGPALQRSGRCGWLPLPGGDRTLKFKGLAPQARPDGSLEAYWRTNAHVGFGSDGIPVAAQSAPAPLGGSTLDRARAEYLTAARLSAADAGAVRPVRLYYGVGARFGPGAAQLGLVVTVLPTGGNLRADGLLAPVGDPRRPDPIEIARLRAATGAVDEPALLGALCHRYGAALRSFTRAGFYRHSGSLDNWSVAVETGDVFLTDLDSTQQLTQAPVARRRREPLRDLASGLFNLAAALMAPDGPVLLRAQPVAAAAAAELVLGWEPALPRTAVTRALDPFLAYWRPLARRSAAGTGARPAGAVRSVWMDRDLAYCLLLCGLAPLASGPDDDLRADCLPLLGPRRHRRLLALLDTASEEVAG